ncbi:MAG: D-glycero-alpha-D-manno-heptose-1,7-bisphosphate 7-phosphatase [Bellilinea sp.]
MNPLKQNSHLQAIFLDRDGVIIHNRASYVRHWEDVRFYSSSLRALQAINNLQNRPKVFIITNQSAIGRGLMTLEQYQEIDRKIQEVIFTNGGFIDRVFFCPHAPEENCDCRKPKAGMILEAANQFGIDLHQSILIGDAQSDIEAGYAAGIPELYLVITGRGKKQLDSIREQPYFKQVRVFRNLFEIISTIL